MTRIAMAVIASCVIIGAIVYAYYNNQSSRFQRIRNLKLLFVSINNYGNDGSRYSTLDAPGRYSWRVKISKDFLILKPCYDYNKPWDSENNTLCIDQMPDNFSITLDGKRGITNYVAIKGIGTPWNEMITNDGLNNITNHGLLVVEIANSEQLWTEPKDLTKQEFIEWWNRNKDSLGSRPLAMFSDGMVREMSDKIIDDLAK